MQTNDMILDVESIWKFASNKALERLKHAELKKVLEAKAPLEHEHLFKAAAKKITKQIMVVAIQDCVSYPCQISD